MNTGVKTDAERKGDRFSLIVATPSHRGMFCTAYMHSVVGLQEYCLTNGIDFDVRIVQVSNVDRARNLLASTFLLHTSATHMLFIDDDMGFNVDEAVKMFEWRDKDVVAALYPKKKLDWQRVKQIVLSNPDIESARLPGLASVFDLFMLPGEASGMTIGDEPVPVAAVGTGLMLISRQCLLKLIETANLPTVARHSLTGGPVHEFFKTQIVNGQQMGEDYFFCNLVRRHGGEVFGCPWLTVTHSGQYTFVGDLKGLARYALRG